MGTCPTTIGALRKMGCKTSGGRLFCADRSGAETARHPGDVCSAPTEAKRKMGRVRSGGPHATSRPSRRRDLEPWVQGSLRLWTIRQGPNALLDPCLIVQCGRWDLNPHDCNNHKILSLARLPVPTLPHIFDFLSLVSRDFDIISNQTKYVNTYFYFYIFFSFIMHLS